MKTFILFFISIATIAYAFHLRIEEGNAGIFALFAIPALFYLMGAFSYGFQDYRKNRYNGYRKR